MCMLTKLNDTQEIVIHKEYTDIFGAGITGLMRLATCMSNFMKPNAAIVQLSRITLAQQQSHANKNSSTTKSCLLVHILWKIKQTEWILAKPPSTCLWYGRYFPVWFHECIYAKRFDMGWQPAVTDDVFCVLTYLIRPVDSMGLLDE